MRTTFCPLLGAAFLLGTMPLPTQAAVTLLSLDATVGVEEADGDPAEDGDEVSRWLDQGGLGNHATLSPFGGSTTATYSTTDHLGSPAVVFDAASDRYRVSTLSLSSTSNYYISATIKGSGAGERIIATTYGGGAGTNGLEFYLYNKSLHVYANGFSLNSANTGKFITDNTWTDVALEKDGNLYRLFVNGQVADSGTSGVSFSGFPYLTIGSGGDYSGAVFGSMANLTILQIPEPSVAALGLLGLLGLIKIRRRTT